jgi:hypothetical protein
MAKGGKREVFPSSVPPDWCALTWRLLLYKIAWEGTVQRRQQMAEWQERYASGMLCCCCGENHVSMRVSEWMAIPTKRSREEEHGTSMSGATPGKLLGSLPELWDFLTRPKDQDGKIRALATLSVKCERSGLRVSLNDEHSGSYATAIGVDLESVLTSLEKQLKEDTIDWKQSKWGKGKGR